MPLVLRLVTGSALTYAQMDGNLTYLDNKVTGSNNFFTIYSGSNALTSSILFQSGKTLLLSGSLNISGSTTITGSLNISGSTTITGSLNISGSIINSGSLNISGSTTITGSFTVITGSGIEFQVLDTGVRIGNMITDNHTVTGSLNTTGSVTINNILTIAPTGSLPTSSIASGSFMTSGSGINLKPYFWNGATWTPLF